MPPTIEQTSDCLLVHLLGVAKWCECMAPDGPAVSQYTRSASWNLDCTSFMTSIGLSRPAKNVHFLFAMLSDPQQQLHACLDPLNCFFFRLCVRMRNLATCKNTC